jgi:ABC-type nitrate/sulfonate/bicarbonate transport system substrate-binding protein
VPDVGQRAGIFKKHGLILEILYTNGGGETMQAVISGSVDLGISAGRVLCHEHRRSKRQCATVREMEEGPSSSAIRC